MPSTPSEDAKVTPAAFWPQHFSTLSVPVRDQFEAWRALLAETIELRPLHSAESGFPAYFSSWSFAGLTLTHATFLRARPRAWSHRPRSWNDHWCLVLAKGAGVPGASSLSLRTLSLPFQGEGEDAEVITLYVPRDRMAALVRNPDRLHGTQFGPGLSGALAGYLGGLVAHLPEISGQEQEQVARVTLSMLAACLAPAPDNLRAARGPLAVQFLERARTIIRQHMGSPGFGPDQLCRLLAVSRSKLYRIFEESGGVAQFIQRERLCAAHQRLCNAGETASIHMIGHDVGFLDHSTFSRAFRREYGCSPSEVRESALAVSRGAFPVGADGGLRDRAPRTQ